LDSWHTAAINGHSHFRKVFASTLTEGDMLKEKNLYPVAQLSKVDDLTGRLTTDENRALFEELLLFLLLRHEFRLLIRTLVRAPTVDNLVRQVATALKSKKQLY
jgi:hypothetical protein